MHEVMKMDMGEIVSTNTNRAFWHVDIRRWSPRLIWRAAFELDLALAHIQAGEENTVEEFGKMINRDFFTR